MKSRNIELHIDELVLDGFENIDSDQFGETLQLELSRLFSERGIPALLNRGGALARLDAGEAATATDSTEGSTARQVARAIYGGFEK